MALQGGFMENRDSLGRFVKKHGMKHTKLYKVWSGMKERCYNKHNKSFKNYGLKGIKVCDNWVNDFSRFYDWSMQHGYHEGLTIDRIDGNKNYEPENCRWITTKQQNRNYARNHKIKLNNKEYCIVELAEMYDIKATTILYRLKAGYSPEQSIIKGDLRYGTK